MLNKFRFTVLLSALLALPLAHADEPRQLMWADLVPPSAEMQNPFLELSRDQLTFISDIAAVRDRQARGDTTLTPAELQTAETLTAKLEKAGVDVDGLLAMRAEIAERGRAVVEELDGKVVRIPGYLLPLEFSGKKVTEFLLVPWVGACIHTPPPPPNQIVHVKPEQPVEMTGMFAPVWVTGPLDTGALTRRLSMIDGSADINIGYSLRATEVAAYSQ
ncbi:MAG: DUF3299 domain-containing protein [Betaproteobacteria bacterium]|nr:MAG: DUF3299 domain-containing protein [Betaproteobacteria bacterium]